MYLREHSGYISCNNTRDFAKFQLEIWIKHSFRRTDFVMHHLQVALDILFLPIIGGEQMVPSDNSEYHSTPGTPNMGLSK